MYSLYKYIMIIPIRCMSCGKVLADKWVFYEQECKKIEQQDENNEEPAAKGIEKVSRKKILDDLGLTRICCRRHMLGHVDLIDVI
jgi:DNA-directed RNA polymerase subunit N